MTHGGEEPGLEAFSFFQCSPAKLSHFGEKCAPQSAPAADPIALKETAFFTTVLVEMALPYVRRLRRRPSLVILLSPLSASAALPVHFPNQKRVVTCTAAASF